MTEQPTALWLAAVPIFERSITWQSQATMELRRLHHNNQVLMDALWKACGDDEGVVNDTIASEGELK